MRTPTGYWPRKLRNLALMTLGCVLVSSIWSHLDGTPWYWGLCSLALPLLLPVFPSGSKVEYIHSLLRGWLFLGFLAGVTFLLLNTTPRFWWAFWILAGTACLQTWSAWRTRKAPHGRMGSGPEGTA